MRDLVQHFLNYKRDQNGVTAVEFSFVALAFFSIMFGIMQAAHALWVYNGVQYATERASRVALVNETITDTELEDIATTELQNMSITPTSFTLSTSSSTQGGVEFKTISTTYQYNAFMTTFLPESMQHFTMQASVSRPVNW